MSYGRHPVRHQILGGKICVDEHEDRTGATARLHRRDRKLLGVGQTRLDPGDQFPDTLGEQLAVARALSHVARQLLSRPHVTSKPSPASLVSAR